MGHIYSRLGSNRRRRRSIAYRTVTGDIAVGLNIKVGVKFLIAIQRNMNAVECVRFQDIHVGSRTFQFRVDPVR